MINSDLRERFIKALDSDGRTATDVLSQAIKTYIVGGEIADRFIAMQSEINSLKEHRRRQDNRIYQLNRYLYRILNALATGVPLQLNRGEIDAIEFAINNPEQDGENKPEEFPGNKRTARPKRKRGRPRKDEQLLKKLERAEKKVEPSAPSKTE